MERRLSAILAADVVGYTRMMGADEAGTLDALKAMRAEVVDPKVAEHQGRVVTLTGDGILVEFPSVVNAVACAAAIQMEMRDRNSDTPPQRQFRFRIGVDLGDVIVEGEDIYGDGVNVAVRLESVAKPGGIVISQSVRDQIGNRLEIAFEDYGEKKLKNIERPVRDREDTKPSIAVLPFTNMSGDPEQEYFSDGITEDLITDCRAFPACLWWRATRCLRLKAGPSISRKSCLHQSVLR
jgi:adenylate cyclase